MSSAPSRSSADAVAAALTAAADDILREVDALRASGVMNPVVLIDGRSGSGKTTLVSDVTARWRLLAAVQVVALDDLYPGWDGLHAGAEAARAQILEPHARGETGHWGRWDWSTEAYAESHPVDAARPVVIEGSGVLTSAAAVLADVRVWLESPSASRRQRALARDGDLFRPHWARWAVQEEQHLRRDDPRALATLVFEVP